MIIPVEPARHPLEESGAPADPMVLFARWMDDVVSAGLPEPTAMVLATVSPAGGPRARTVLLKDSSPEGLVFYTNRSSAKGQHLAANPYACLVFPWHPIQRQVIIEGPAEALSTSESEPYFHSRPRGSQLGAWAAGSRPCSRPAPNWKAGTRTWRHAGRRGRPCPCRSSGVATAWCPR